MVNTTHKRFGIIHSLVNNEKIVHKIMIFPAVAALFGIMYPFLVGVLTSFTDTKLYEQGFNIVFLQNYINNFRNPVFLTSLSNTLLFTFIAIAFQIPLGILAALILDTKTRIRPFLRSVLVFPLLIPPVVAGLMWRTMMQPASGVLNFFLRSLGLEGFPFLSGLHTALLSLAVIDTWIYLPLTTIILLSGLQSLPQDMGEAAQVDGASPLRVFISIKLPWLYPSILLTMLFRVSDSLKIFDIIYATTRGGPLNASRTLNIMAYEEAFRWSNTGRALSIVFTLWIIAYIISTLLIKKWHKSAIEL